MFKHKKRKMQNDKIELQKAIGNVNILDRDVIKTEALVTCNMIIAGIEQIKDSIKKVNDFNIDNLDFLIYTLELKDLMNKMPATLE